MYVAKPLLLIGVPRAIQILTEIDGQGTNGYIKGKVTENNIGVSRRVMCYRRRTGVLLYKTMSDENGDYYIGGLIAGLKYFVTSIDENEDSMQYNAVTQDLITASEVTP